MKKRQIFCDYSLPDGVAVVAGREIDHGQWACRSARWTGPGLGDLGRLLASRPNLLKDGLTHEQLWTAWAATVAELRDPESAARQQLAAPLARLCRLSSEGLAAGLEAVLGGVSAEPARAVFREATAHASEPGLVVVILASNLPGLAAQSLLPALALGRPVVVKSASAEPLFTPVLIEALCRREPRLRSALAAVTWPGGEDVLEDALFPWAAKVVAYGGAAAMAALRAKVGSRLVARGPKLSIALVGADADLYATARGLAADIALFDQRGCLSIQAVYTAGDPVALAGGLAAALADRRLVWPPGDIDPWDAGRVQELRAEAVMRGLFQPSLELSAGTVVVETGSDLRPSPGLRTVRIYPVASLQQVPPALRAWQGQLQGAALAGRSAWSQEEELRALGVTRLAPPGELQSPDASWHNGGVSPLQALGSRGGGE